MLVSWLHQKCTSHFFFWHFLWTFRFRKKFFFMDFRFVGFLQPSIHSHHNNRYVNHDYSVPLYVYKAPFRPGISNNRHNITSLILYYYPLIMPLKVKWFSLGFPIIQNTLFMYALPGTNRIYFIDNIPQKKICF